MQSNPANTAVVVWQKSCLTFAARQCKVIWHHTDKFAELQNPVPWILNHLWLNTQCFPFTMIFFWMNWDEVNENPDFTVLQQSTTDMLKQGWSQMTGSFCQPLLIYCFKHQNPYNALLCAIFVFVVGILQHPDGTVLKQLQPPPRGPREMQFYSMVMSALINNSLT